MQSKSIIDYCNKLILAPMVRGSLLPLRLLALRHGADLVYTDEIIDHSMLLTTRKVNDSLGTIDYVNENNAFLLFRTTPIEKEKLVFQIGTSDADRAIRAAKMVQHDVSAIDINMGCPKKFSTVLGVGAALLSNVDNAKRIVKALVDNIQLPITCKIRILDDINKTIAMVKDFETLGVSAVAVHGRTRYQRHGDPVNIDAIRKIAESVNIPIIANGGSTYMKNLDDVLKFRDDCGTTSVMVARAAQMNVGPIPLHDLITEYLKLCIDYDNCCTNIKYSINIMYRSPHSKGKSSIFKSLQAATTLEEICDIWNLGEYCREKKSQYKAKGMKSLGVTPPSSSHTPVDILESREQTFNETNIIVERLHYRRNYFGMSNGPKAVLKVYCDRHQISLPTYETKRVDRQFYSILTFQGKQYTSSIYHRNAKHSEQAAALVCSFHLGIYEENFLLSVGSLIKS